MQWMQLFLLVSNIDWVILLIRKDYRADKWQIELKLSTIKYMNSKNDKKKMKKLNRNMNLYSCTIQSESEIFFWIITNGELSLNRK